MIKRVALFFMVITAIPAVLVSLPVWAEDFPLDIKVNYVEGYAGGVASSLKIYPEGSSQLWHEFEGPINDDWTGTTPPRGEKSSVIYLTIGGSDKLCYLAGSRSSSVPLYDTENQPVTAVDILVDGSANCTWDYATPPGEKGLNIFTYSDMASSTALFAYDYKTEEEELGWHNVPVAANANGDETQLILNSGTSYTQIEYGTETCAYSGGTDTKITAPAEGESTSVHVQIENNECTLYNDVPPEGAIAIRSCEDLQNIGSSSDKPLDGDYILEIEILEWCVISPIPNSADNNKPFTGTLDGNQNAINNLTINSGASDSDIGLFKVFQGEIKNLNFDTICVGGKNVWCTEASDTTFANRGLIAAKASAANNGTKANVKNIKVKNLKVLGGDTAGNYYAGGLIGYAENTELSDISINTAVIQKPAYAGGLIGAAGSNVNITNAFVNVFSSDPNFASCKNENDDRFLANEGCGVGGLIGLVKGIEVRIKTSTAKGEIKGEDKNKFRNAGGLVGVVYNNGAGKVLGITDSYAKVGIENVSHNAGGVIGFSQEGDWQDNVTFYKVYAVGKISGCNGCRGMVGNPKTTSTTVWSQYSFYDKNVSGQGEPGDKNGAFYTEPETTAAMKSNKLYEDDNWSKSTWCIKTTDYPTLISEYADPTQAGCL